MPGGCSKFWVLACLMLGMMGTMLLLSALQPSQMEGCLDAMPFGRHCVC